MEMNLKKPSRLSRLFFTWFQFVWQWSFRLVTYGLMLWVLLNWNRLSLRLFLTPETSLVRNLGALLLALALIQIGVSFLHELGHLGAGYLANLKSHLFMIGPFQFLREGEETHLRLRRGLGIFNGLTASIPLDNKHLKRRMLIFALGGPLVSFLSFLLFGALFYWVMQQNRGLYEQRAWPWELLFIGSFFSLTTFLSTMRPGLYSNGYSTDGGRIAILLENGKRAWSWYAQVLLNSADIRGVRPRDWEKSIVAQATIDQPPSVDLLMSNWLAYFAAVDRGDVQSAAVYLESASNNRGYVAGGFKLKVMIESAFFHAWHQQDLAAAEPWLAFLKRPYRQLHPQYYRAKTAVALLKNNRDEAQKFWELAYEAYQTVDQKGGVWQAEMAWLAEMNPKQLSSIETQKAS